MTALALRDYQGAALAAIGQAEQRGIRRQLIALPTGTGKTVCFAHLGQRRGGRTLVLVHRDELVRQTVDKFHLIAPGVRVGVVKAAEDETDAQIVVASIQTLARARRLSRLRADFRTVIVDECHHAPAESYRSVLAHVRAGEPDGPLLTGWTATPERGDKIRLSDVFEEIVFERDILTMIEAGYLSDLRAVQIHLEADFGEAHTRAGDYVDRDLEGILMAANAPEQIVRVYQEHAAGRRAILFAPTVDSAYQMADRFGAAGIVAGAIDATTPIEDRRAVLANFRSGRLTVLANVGVLTEGFDDPGVSCIIIARPTKSRPLYVQMIGRGTRLYPGKDDCLILDVVGSTTQHELVTTASLFGLDPNALGNHTVTAAVARKRERDNDAAEAVEQAGRLVAATVDLFKGRRMNWLSVGDRWVLTTGNGQISLDLTGDGSWSATQRERGQAPAVIAQNVPLDYAQGIAEDTVRKAGKAVLADRSAPWRQTPVSERQLEVLRRYRLRADADLTKGEASDLLDLYFAKRRGGPVAAGR